MRRLLMLITLLLCFQVVDAQSDFEKTETSIKETRQRFESLEQIVKDNQQVLNIQDTVSFRNVRLNIDTLLSYLSFIRGESDDFKSEKISKLKTKNDQIANQLKVLEESLNNAVISGWKEKASSSNKDILDIAFMTFTSDKNGPETKYYKNSNEINEMYKKYDAVKLPMRIADNGRIEGIVSCDDILNVGLCIPMAKYDSLSIQSALRVLFGDNSVRLNTLISSLQKDVTSGEGLIWIWLADLFKKAYYKPVIKSEVECCPDNQESSWQEELTSTLCSALQSNNGLEVTATGKSKHTQVVLRTYGLGAKNITNGSSLQKIEPRQYVTIYEKEKLDGDARPIWWLLKKPDKLIRQKYPEYAFYNSNYSEKFYPVQEYSTVDLKTILEVRFDQEMLADNIDFYGNISLAATIENRPIEVSPYSMIGKAQKSYGVNSKPIKEIASHFLTLLRKANDVRKESQLIEHRISDYEKRIESIKNSKEAVLYKTRLRNIAEILKSLQSKLLSANSFIPLDAIGESIVYELRQLDTTIFKPIQILLNEKNNAEENQSSDLKFNNILDLPNIDSNVSMLFTNVIDKYNRQLIELYEFDVKRELISISGYEIKTSGLADPFEQIKFPLDSPKINNIITSLNGIIDEDDLKVEKIENVFEDDLFRLAQGPAYDLNTQFIKFQQNVQLCLQLMEYFDASGLESKEAFLNLSQLTVIEFERMLDRIKRVNDDIKNASFSDELSEDEFRRNVKLLLVDFNLLSDLNEDVFKELFRTNFQNDNKNAFNQDWLDPDFRISDYSDSLENKHKEAVELIAKKAGAHLFSRMLYATIDLEESGVKEGEMLEIKVMWYNIDPNTPNAEEGIELSTAKFLVKKTGWHLEASESVLLIDRINQDLVTVDVSPSNFKPTAGASLMCTYHNDNRGKSGWSRFFKWLEPSFGLNVSYVDFDSSETFEVGAGPIVGFWGNRLFFTGGYNFSVAGQSPYYMGIGFSFYNVIEKIKTGGKLKEN